MSTHNRILTRDGETMVEVSVTTRPAVIQFSDILERVKVEPDDFAEAPWDNSDGYEHEVIDDNTDGESVGSFSDSRGKMKRVITKEFSDWGSAGRGASKQVQFEAHAKEVARSLRQIVKWYENGWSVWCVSCSYLGCSDSLCGIYDDDGDYVEEQKSEIAANVAAELEEQGYTVEGKPSPRNRIADAKYWHARKLNSQNW